MALAGALLVGASFWYLELTFLEPIARRWLEGREVGEMLQRTLLPDDVPLAVIVALVALFPGVCEELLFRGVLLRAFRPRLGAAGAVALSGALFALFHVHPAHMLPNLAFGILLGTAVLVTDSLMTAMVVHTIHNAVVLAFAGNVWPEVTARLEAHPTAAVLVAAAASFAGLSLMWAGRGSARKPSAVRDNQGSS
jgi:membrane protease YdiL (CAAX protease family)